MSTREQTAEHLFTTLPEMEQAERVIANLVRRVIEEKQTKIWFYKEIDKTPYNQLLKFHMVATVSATLEHMRNPIFNFFK